MRILVTGAAGMLGNDLRRHFTRIGHEVVCADRQSADAPDTISMDITKPHEVAAVFERVRPGLVIHAAAYTNVDGCERDPDAAFQGNAFGTWTVACAAETVGTPLVAISTDFVFDGKKGSPYTEFDRPNPLSRYGASKLAGEEIALRHCSRSYVVRTSWLYGVHGNNFPFTVAKRARELGELSVVADQVGTPTYTKDLAVAIEQIVREPLYGIYHASNEGETTWLEFAKAVLERVGLGNTPVNPLTSAECAAKFNTPTERPAYSVMRNYALELRGETPMRPWQDALDAFVEEAKAAGKL